MSKKSVEFHIKSGDYFGTLAAVLSLVEQILKDDKENRKILKNVVKDLLYLQKNYIIVKNKTP
jgi:hypothetical protein